MRKTGQQIEDDIFGMVRTSPLASFVNGTTYKFGTRPRGSVKEDIVVKFVTGLDGQIQDGVVVVNIFVPDIDSSTAGYFVRNINRCKQIEMEANIWAATLTAAESNYKFSLSQMIYTQEEPEIKQHFITVRLKFQLTTF